MTCWENEIQAQAADCDTMRDWTSDNPKQVGWYATIHCWDADEGMFPGAHYWDGTRWQPETSASIQHWLIVFESEELARDYAYEHDPEL